VTSSLGPSSRFLPTGYLDAFFIFSIDFFFIDAPSWFVSGWNSWGASAPLGPAPVLLGEFLGCRAGSAGFSHHLQLQGQDPPSVPGTSRSTETFRDPTAGALGPGMPPHTPTPTSSYCWEGRTCPVPHQASLKAHHFQPWLWVGAGSGWAGGLGVVKDQALFLAEWDLGLPFPGNNGKLCLSSACHQLCGFCSSLGA
jgi:hypothetical protein